jgi:hypothetical protein
MKRTLFIVSVLTAWLLLCSNLSASEKVTLKSLLRQMTDLSFLAQYPDPPYVTKQFSSYDRASESPANHDTWFANSDRGFMLYDGVMKEKMPYFRSSPQQASPPEGYFQAGTKVGLAPNRRPQGNFVWAYATAADGKAIDGKIPQGWVDKSMIQMDPQGHVLAEMDGPGSIVNIWSANPEDAGKIRIYLDGAKEPAIEAPLRELLGGKWQTETSGKKWIPFPDPIACERSRGWNLYFPIAYAKHCKICAEKQDFYYHVDYRTYPKGMGVETFALSELAGVDLSAVGARLKRAFENDLARGLGNVQMKGADLKPGEHFEVGVTGPGRIRRLSVRMLNPSAEALRSTMLIGMFDGARAPQIWCPLGDFFGTGPGANLYHSLPLEITRGLEAPQGAEKEIPEIFRKSIYFNARWPMPFQKSAVFELIYVGKQPSSGEMTLQVTSDNYDWADRSMYFHAKWRTQKLNTRPFRDWNFCEVKGQGVFVGDMLSILNPVSAWWGEGDEKIYVDGEKFPSWFGTGTEDYFAYAWSDPKPFQHPYHNQTRCDGPGTFGFTSVNRFHILDAIPFEKSFKFDMELWHWVPNIDVTLAATSYWYARPGATDNFAPADPKDLVVPALPPPYKIEGAIEGEKMKILGKSSDFPADLQHMLDFSDGGWSGNSQLWGGPPTAGEWIDLELPVPADGKYNLSAHLTKARDYGIVQLSLDGRKIGKPIDCFFADSVIATGPIDLGVLDLKKGTATLRLEVVGTNPKSTGLRTMWGLDCVVLKPVSR